MSKSSRHFLTVLLADAACFVFVAYNLLVHAVLFTVDFCFFRNWDPLRGLAISKIGLYVHVAVRPPLNLEEKVSTYRCLNDLGDTRGEE